MLEKIDKKNEPILSLKKVYVLYEISSSLLLSVDTTKNFFSIMNTLYSRLETKKGAFIALDIGSGKKNNELLFGFDEEDIKSGRYNINNDIIRNIVYTKDVVFLIKTEAGIEAKGAQMANFIDKDKVSYICVPVLNEQEKVAAVFVVDRLFDGSVSLEKEVFFMHSIAAAISKNLKLKNSIDLEKRILFSENDRLKQELRSNYQIRNIISTNEEVLKVIENVKQVADSDVPILLTGEIGTGKGLIAKALHYNSKRVGNAFIKIYCGAFPESLIAMEMFGNESEEFGTGQPQSKRGKFEAADRGTIYLESIESMPISVQAKLLKYLKEGEFEKEGIGRVVKADVRVIVGATRGLEELVEQNKILPELYQELNIIHIVLPELKNRREDIPLLIRHFIKKYSKENHKKISDVSPEVLDKFMNYQWPGNVRELENCIKRMIIMSNSKILDESLLPNNIRNIVEEERQYEGSVEAVINGILKDKLERIVSFFSARRRKNSSIYKRITDNIDKVLIELSLKKCNNIQTDAAKFLGINRNTLRSKIEKLKIDNSNFPKETKSSKRKSRKNLDLPFK